MARKFDLIVFDLDGTLFDTKATIVDSIKYMIESEGLRRLTDEEVRKFLGPPLEVSMRKFYPDISDDEIYRLMDVYRQHYIDVQLLKAEPYPYIIDVLTELKKEGYKIALATYKLLKCVTPLFKHYDLIKYFDSIRGSIDGKNYTKVDIINQTITDCDIKDLRRVCMIGDTEHDFRGAIHCGISFIGMTYGFGYTGMNDDELKYKEFLGYCDKAKEILDLLN